MLRRSEQTSFMGDEAGNAVLDQSFKVFVKSSLGAWMNKRKIFLTYLNILFLVWHLSYETLCTEK